MHTQLLMIRFYPIAEHYFPHLYDYEVCMQESGGTVDAWDGLEHCDHITDRTCLEYYETGLMMLCDH